MKLLRNFMMALALVAFVSCGNEAAKADSKGDSKAEKAKTEKCDNTASTKDKCADKAACAEKKCGEGQCTKADCAKQ